MTDVVDSAVSESNNNIPSSTTPSITKFPSEEIQSAGQEIVGNILGSHTYTQSEVGKWTDQIVNEVMSRLTNKYPGQFKFIVTAVLMQKTGAGLNTAAACFWDSTTDGSCLVRWENKTMTVIVQVFGVALIF
jgi:dynein light chain Tctex-type 1